MAYAFGIGPSSVKRYAAAAREGGSLAPKGRPGSGPEPDEGARRPLEADLEGRPVATLPQGRVFPRWVCGVEVSDPPRVSRRVERLGRSRKRYAGSGGARRVLEGSWQEFVAGMLTGRLVFVDEMGTNTSLVPLYAWSPEGSGPSAALHAVGGAGANFGLESARGLSPTSI